MNDRSTRAFAAYEQMKEYAEHDMDAELQTGAEIFEQEELWRHLETDCGERYTSYQHFRDDFNREMQQLDAQDDAEIDRPDDDEGVEIPNRMLGSVLTR